MLVKLCFHGAGKRVRGYAGKIKLVIIYIACFHEAFAGKRVRGQAGKRFYVAIKSENAR